GDGIAAVADDFGHAFPVRDIAREEFQSASERCAGLLAEGSRIPILPGHSGYPEILRQKAFGLQPRQRGQKVAKGQVSGRAGNDQAADHIRPPFRESFAKSLRFSHAVKKLFYGYSRQTVIEAGARDEEE